MSVKCTRVLFENQGLTQLHKNVFVTDVVLAEQLSLSVNTIRKWRAQERIPYRKFGRSIRYKMDEVVEAISKEEN